MILSRDNFTFFAAKLYDINKANSIECFHKDLTLFNQLNRHLCKLVSDEDTEKQIRYLLNKVITIYNIFSPPIRTTDLILFKVDIIYHLEIKTILSFLGFYSGNDISEELMNKLKRI